MGEKTQITIAIAVSILALVLLALGCWWELRKAAQKTDEQQENALLAPHAKWLHQHDIDRRFNAIVDELKAGAE